MYLETHSVCSCLVLNKVKIMQRWLTRVHYEVILKECEEVMKHFLCTCNDKMDIRSQFLNYHTTLENWFGFWFEHRAFETLWWLLAHFTFFYAWAVKAMWRMRWEVFVYFTEGAMFSFPLQDADITCLKCWVTVISQKPHQGWIDYFHFVQWAREFLTYFPLK